MKKIELEDLWRRVHEYRLVKLPGQPKPIHMETYYLINDLMAAIDRLADEIKAIQGESR